MNKEMISAERERIAKLKRMRNGIRGVRATDSNDKLYAIAFTSPETSISLGHPADYVLHTEYSHTSSDMQQVALDFESENPNTTVVSLYLIHKDHKATPVHYPKRDSNVDGVRFNESNDHVSSNATQNDKSILMNLVHSLLEGDQDSASKLLSSYMNKKASKIINQV